MADESISKDIWLERAANAYSQSTSYVDNNYRKKWNEALRFFQSKHQAGSKYRKDAYKYRSKVFRPKSRAATRNNEAAAVAAFFANQDVVDVSPQNPNDDSQQASADVMKELLNYRLQKTIPWFLTCIGGYQDGQVVGVMVSENYWDYKERTEKQYEPVINEETGEPLFDEETGDPIMNEIKVTVPVKDEPCIDLFPVENLRIHPSASWVDPIGTSPYVIRLIPMYVGEVKARMKAQDSKTGEPKWKQLDDGEIRSAQKNIYDSTRQTREEDREDSGDQDHTKELGDYDIVWVLKNFIRHEGETYVYYTLGTQYRLTDPKPLKEVVFHGEIPITMGYVVVETHKLFPSGLIELGANLQKEINEIANTRLDNVKLVMNKRWKVKRGSQVDLRALVRNVAGGVTLVEEMGDVEGEEFHDVTGSSYQEQDRLNVDFDETVGSFSASTIQTNRRLNETVGGMQMLKGGINSLVEYSLRVFAETWVEPTLRQLVKLEQYYETDETILAIAAEKAQLVKKYGINKVTDDLLNQELTLNVNVGMGATDPIMRVQNFMLGIRTIVEVIKTDQSGVLDIQEIAKEVFGRIGYKDGARFFIEAMGDDPEKMQMAQVIQQLQRLVQALKAELESNIGEQKTKVLIERMKQSGASQRKEAELKTKLVEKQLDLLNPVVGEKPGVRPQNA